MNNISKQLLMWLIIPYTVHAASASQTVQRDIRLIRLETELNNADDNLVRLYRQEDASLSNALLMQVQQADQYSPMNAQELSADFANFQEKIRAQQYIYLLVACRNGCFDVTQKLFKLGITSFCTDTQGRTPLHNAALSQSGKVVASVTQARDDLERRCQKYWDTNHGTCRLCYTIPKDILQQDTAGKTPLDLYLDQLTAQLLSGTRVSGLNLCLKLLFLRAVSLGAQQEVTKVLSFFNSIHGEIIHANQTGQTYDNILENKRQFLMDGHNGSYIEPAVHFVDPQETFKDSALHITVRNEDPLLLTVLLNSMSAHERAQLVKKKNDCSGGETALTTAIFAIQWYIQRTSATEDKRVNIKKVQDLQRCITLLRAAGAVTTQQQDEVINRVSDLLTPAFIANPVLKAIFPPAAN